MKTWDTLHKIAQVIVESIIYELPPPTYYSLGAYYYSSKANNGMSEVGHGYLLAFRKANKNERFRSFAYKIQTMHGPDRTSEIRWKGQAVSVLIHIEFSILVHFFFSILILFFS